MSRWNVAALPVFLLLAACCAPLAPPASTDTPVWTATPALLVTPTAAPTQKPTATAEPTSTAKPTSTPSPAPTSTAVPSATPTPEPTATPTEMPAAAPSPTDTPTASPCEAPDAALAPILSHAQSLGYDIGCPVAPAFSVAGAFQEFWANVDEVNPHLHYRSLMIWRSDMAEIYVIDGRDTDVSEGNLLAYTDTWGAGEPLVHPSCAGMTVPGGYQLPVRGFGKVWCVNQLADPVGWPTDDEAAVALLVQPTQTGLLLKVSGPIPIGYLVALDYRAVWAVTQMINP